MADGSRVFEFRRRVGDDASELDEVASADGSAEAWRGGADVSRGDGIHHVLTEGDSKGRDVRTKS